MCAREIYWFVVSSGSCLFLSTGWFVDINRKLWQISVHHGVGSAPKGHWPPYKVRSYWIPVAVHVRMFIAIQHNKAMSL